MKRTRRQDPAALPDAVVLDLDGVVTRTAELHRTAWKEVLDALLTRVAPGQPPFDAREDYRAFLDGLPRLDGIGSFLSSRGLQLPAGGRRDTFADGTVHGIANRKNERFRQLLEKRGAEVFHDAVSSIEGWRDLGIPIAVVSSSRNCRAVLDSAGLTRLFDARVDGETLAESGMAGKPAPDMFLAAAAELGVDSRRSAAFEDAIAGVEAARRGDFGIVIGVDRDGGREAALRRAGADLVVPDLSDLELDLEAVRRDRTERTTAPAAPSTGGAGTATDDPPLLLDRLDVLGARLDGHSPILFLDFDGTLSPIVPRPEDARLAEGMRERLRRVADHLPVVIVSGRDREDVRARVGLDDLIVAGSHGFDIAGPGLHRRHDEAEAALPALNAAEKDLRAVAGEVPGAQVERKRFGVALHHRNVAETDVSRLERAVQEAVERHPGLRRTTGKMVQEVQPDLPWDKGRAVQWILDELGLASPDVVPFHVGDDVTDEDAFTALPSQGVGVLVADQPRTTAAGWRVRDVDEVARLLDWIAARFDAAATSPSAPSASAAVREQERESP